MEGGVFTVLFVQLEELGANGRVDEVREVMTLLEQLEKERDAERKSVNCWGPKVQP